MMMVAAASHAPECIVQACDADIHLLHESACSTTPCNRTEIKSTIIGSWYKPAKCRNDEPLRYEFLRGI